MPFLDPSNLGLLAPVKVPVIQQELGLRPDNTAMHGKALSHCFETCHCMSGLSDSGGTSGSLPHSPPCLSGTTTEDTTGGTKSSQMKESNFFQPSLGDEEENRGITFLWVNSHH